MSEYTNIGTYLKAAHPLQGLGPPTNIMQSGDYLLFADFPTSPGSFLVLQYDGNLCLYKGSGPADNEKTLWCATDKPQGTGTYTLWLMDTSELIITAGTWQNPGAQVWSSGTSHDVSTDYYLGGALWSEPGGSLPYVGVWKGSESGPTDWDPLALIYTMYGGI